MSTKHVHVLTDAHALFLLKQLPGFSPQHDGFAFSFGLDIPKNADAIIVWNRSQIGFQTHLPNNRIAFIAVESEDVRNISRRFLNQFGLVHSPTEKQLDVPKIKSSPCFPWIAGVSFADATNPDSTKGYDFFKSYKPRSKTPKVSIVTSKRSSQPLHIKRLEFVERLQELIPEHLEIYGRGIRPVDDKMEALAPCQYHLALENSLLPDSWTEKIADPFLCWSHPFYVGPKNTQDYFPKGSFTPLDLDDPDEAAEIIVAAIENDHWKKHLPELKKAREIILEDQNAGCVLLRVAKSLFDLPAEPESPKPRRIHSDLSLIAEKRSFKAKLDWLVLNIALLVDRDCELKFWRKRSKRRAADAIASSKTG